MLYYNIMTKKEKPGTIPGNPSQVHHTGINLASTHASNPP
jgi:hypothetical protein